MQRILITGSAGFIGYHLAHRLAQSPRTELVLIDNFIRGERDALYRQLTELPNVRAFNLDLCDPDQYDQLPDTVDVIYHQAALNGTQNFYECPYEVLRSGTLPTFYLIQKYVQSRHATRFVYAGTPESYASTVTRFNWPIPTDEKVPLCIDDVFNVRWSYAAAKLHGEVLVVNACRQFNVPFSVIRYHNVYGPRMGNKHVVPDFLERLRRNVVELHGSQDTRSFLYIDDAVEATLRVGESPRTAGEVINIGNDQEITILELARRMLQLLGRKDEIRELPSPSGSVNRRTPAVQKLAQLTGFRPQWTLDQGLWETMKFYLPSDMIQASSRVAEAA